MKLKTLVLALESAGYPLNVETAEQIINLDDFCFYDRLYSISHTFGLVGFVIAENEQEALDIACDEEHMTMFEVSMPPYDEQDSDLCFLGNHSKPHDLSDCFIKELT